LPQKQGLLDLLLSFLPLLLLPQGKSEKLKFLPPKQAIKPRKVTHWLLWFKHIYRHIFFLGVVGLGFEFRASHLQSRDYSPWDTPPAYFALVILEMGSHDLFAWAGLEQQSSLSQSPK
jgi:hypothetical protein